MTFPSGKEIWKGIISRSFSLSRYFVNEAAGKRIMVHTHLLIDKESAFYGYYVLIRFVWTTSVWVKWNADKYYINSKFIFLPFMAQIMK